MTADRSRQRYRRWYARLLRCYPQPYRERFGEGMEQTFNDVCRERSDAGEGLLVVVLWMFVETAVGMMREHMAAIIAQRTTKRLMVWAAAIALLLMIPLVAMQFSDDVVWSLSDFIIIGVVLFGIGLAYELVARRVSVTVYRVAFGVGLGGALLLFWVNGAVGIIGNEGQPANLLYGAVFVVGLIGSLLARFRPRGMARTLFAAALVQMSVPVLALLIWPPSETSWSPSVFGVFLLSAFFALLFVVSALLFQRASASHPAANRQLE